MVASGMRLFDRRRTLRQQPRKQQARLHLGTGDRWAIGDPAQPGTIDSQRRMPVVGINLRSHLASGSMIRFIGRRESEASPTSSLLNP